jgi:alpha-tubulin suppressor-like RCC1 family protein
MFRVCSQCYKKFHWVRRMKLPQLNFAWAFFLTLIRSATIKTVLCQLIRCGLLANLALCANVAQAQLYIPDKVLSIAAGYDRTCALTGNGALCWGANNYGQLGNGTTDMGLSGPIAVSGLTNVTAIAAGGNHTCALSNGAMQCWGLNSSGELGIGISDSNPHPVPMLVNGLTSQVAITAGYQHTCSLTSGGAVQCWGNNTYGQLGTGNTKSSSTPVAVAGLANVTAISAGAYHTCARTSAGSILCWGSNSSGQLGFGFGDNNPHPAPMLVNGLTGQVAITAGNQHTCSLASGGAVQCWGDNLYGQIGRNYLAPGGPTLVEGLESGVTALSASGSHTCAVIRAAVMCWGGVVTGTGDNLLFPVGGFAGSDVIAVAAGTSDNCALSNGGGVVCWTGRSTPELVVGLANGNIPTMPEWAMIILGLLFLTMMARRTGYKI